MSDRRVRLSLILGQVDFARAGVHEYSQAHDTAVSSAIEANEIIPVICQIQPALERLPVVCIELYFRAFRVTLTAIAAKIRPADVFFLTLDVPGADSLLEQFKVLFIGHRRGIPIGKWL